MRVFVEDCRYPDRVTHATGYAEVQRQIILGLARAGVAVGFPPCRRELGAARLIQPAQREALLRLAEMGEKWRDAADVVFLQVTSPDGFQPRPQRLTVGLTMTERESLSGYPFDWTASCNALDAIITPSHWNQRIFESHGIRNVYVVPLGIDADFFVPRPVRFLSVSAGFGWPGSRTNWEDLMACYKAEFEGVRDVEWTIVSLEARRLFEFGGLRHAARQLPGDVLRWAREAISGGVPRVTVVEGGALEVQELLGIYQTHDCFVSYAREGWGLPILEAMACGLDVIASDYGPPMEFLADGPARLFRGGTFDGSSLRLTGGDLAQLRRHLRSAYDERRRGRRWAQALSWSSSVERLRTLLEDLHASWTRARA